MQQLHDLEVAHTRCGMDTVSTIGILQRIPDEPANDVREALPRSVVERFVAAAVELVLNKPLDELQVAAASSDCTNVN